MLKRSITYTNPFTDEELTEVHHFHISKADFVRMEMIEHKTTYTSKAGEEMTGMRAKLQRIVDAEDGQGIIDTIEEMVRRSYGKKEGDRFLKSEEIWKDFSSSEAYSQLIYDLCTDAAGAADFINGIFPGDLEKMAAEAQAEIQKRENGATPAEEPSQTMDALEKASNALGEGDPTVRKLSFEEARDMDKAELQAGLADGRYEIA